MPSGQVLVVDDYVDSREMLTVALEAEGYAVLTADNGWRALIQAGRHRPDAIVMDLFMPEMDGVEATRRLKSDPDTRAIPVIAYTARASEEGLDLFDDICLKPCPPDRLVRLIDDLLSARVALSEPDLEYVRARAANLRERALTLCRAFTRTSMTSRLGELVATLDQHIERMNAVPLRAHALSALTKALSQSEFKITRLEELLRAAGPDVDGSQEGSDTGGADTPGGSVPG